MRTYTLLLAAIGFVALSCENDETPTTVRDTDGNVYKTVTIGSQVWMAENLKTTHDREGNAIDSPVPDLDASYIETYGRLYTWESALTVCPKGWHLPSADEWFTLLSTLDPTLKDPAADGFVGENTGGVLKSSILWKLPNEGATNSTGFSALPSGFIQDGNLWGKGEFTNFWSSTSGNDDQAFGGIDISYYYASAFRGYMNKEDGHCVRCLKD